MKKFAVFATLFLSVAMPVLLRAQMERTVYQSFEIDSAQTVTLNLVGDFELKKWAGNSILTETNVQIWNASPKILDFFIEKGRYEFTGDKQPAAFSLASKNKERQPIKTKMGDCLEIVKVVVFVPETWVFVVVRDPVVAVFAPSRLKV